jgi:uncharacterized protein (TIGR00255 family)
MASRIRSMTGYASVSRELPQGTLTLELRSVNNRFLDLQFRMPEDARACEPLMRERIAARIARGKVECRVALGASGQGQAALAVDERAVGALLAAAAQVQLFAPGARALSVADILRWPGVAAGQSLSGETLRDALLALCDQALAEFVASREREGARLAEFLLERAQAIAGIVETVRPRIPELLAAQRERMQQRLAESGVAADPDRLAQELVLYAARIDVEEELSRLDAHIAELRGTLERGGTTGKRLDFLMQEFNRESNTLGSKSVDTSTSRAAIELKVLVEQMREQVQNIE